MATFREFITEHLKRGTAFLLIGGIAFVIDAAIFNLLVHVPAHGVLFDYPLVAKAISIVVATTFTYAGNRYLTYRDRNPRFTRRRLAAFVIVNAIAILLQLACLGFSRYVLGLNDPISDNISGTIVGQACATIVRYIGYGKWVFPNDSNTDHLEEAFTMPLAPVHPPEQDAPAQRPGDGAASQPGASDAAW